MLKKKPTTRQSHYYQRHHLSCLGYVHTIADSFWCRHEKLSGILWCEHLHVSDMCVTHQSRDWRCAASLRYRNRAKVTIILICEQRSIWYGVSAGGAKAIRFCVNIVPRWRNAVIISVLRLPSTDSVVSTIPWIHWNPLGHWSFATQLLRKPFYIVHKICRGTQRQFSGKYLFGRRFEI